jgi:hypothetical protein
MSTQASSRSRTVSATTKARISRPRAELFDYFIPIELPRILLGYGPIPAVVSTTDQTGPWDQPGSGRTVHLADRSTAREQVTACERPGHFAYRVGEFSGYVRHVASEANGEWWFTEAGQDTDVIWTYSFTARSRPAQLILLPVVKLLWRGFMRAGMRAFGELAEAEAARSPADSSADTSDAASAPR